MQTPTLQADKDYQRASARACLACALSVQWCEAFRQEASMSGHLAECKQETTSDILLHDGSSLATLQMHN